MRLDISHLTLATLLLALGCTAQDREEVEAAAETIAEESGEAVRTAAAEAGQTVETAAAEARARIMELERTWSGKFGEKDTVWIAERLAENTRIMPPNAEPLVGRDAVRAWWGEMARTEGMRVSWEPVEAHVASSGDMAYDVGTYSMTLPDGSTDSGKYLVVWVKRDGEWKIAADMFSSNEPLPGSS